MVYFNYCLFGKKTLAFFFPYSFPLSFRHGAGQALGGFADGGLSWRHVAWRQPEFFPRLWTLSHPKKTPPKTAAKAKGGWKIWHPTRRVCLEGMSWRYTSIWLKFFTVKNIRKILLKYESTLGPKGATLVVLVLREWTPRNIPEISSSSGPIR